jgi:GAF domain-containing protein
MASVSFAARRILSAAGWETVIPETLSKIGVAARVSRAYVAQVHPAEPGLVGTVLHEWTDPALDRKRPPGRKRAWHGAGTEWERRASSLRRGEVVSFHELASAERNRGSGPRPRSTILVPIEVGGKLVRLPRI